MKTKFKLTDLQFMTAREKNLVLRAWERFLKNELRWQDFTERLYNHLIQHCSFIAHYNRQGFLSTYFGSSQEDTKNFLHQFDPKGNGMSIEYAYKGWLKGDYSDINEAMRVIAGKYVDELYKSLSSAEEEKDLKEAQRLAEKHGLKVVR